MNDDELGDRLIELEDYPEDLRKDLEADIKRVREKALTRWTRASILLWCIPLSFTCMVYLGFSAITAGAGMPLLTRVGAAIVSVTFGALLLWCLVTLKRGTERLRDSTVITSVAWGLVVLFLCKSLLVTRDVDASLVAGLVVVGSAATWARIRASELRLRENILRLELGMIDLVKGAKRGLATDPLTPAPDEQE